MRIGVLRFVHVVPCLLLAACGSKGGSGSGAAADADPNTVVVTEAMVTLGGERISGPPEDKLGKHVELAEKLEQRREKWKTEHPNGPPLATLTLDLGPNVTCLTAVGVFQTAEFKGYQQVLLKQGTTFLDVPGIVPKLTWFADERDDSGRSVFLRMLSGGDVEIRIGPCGGAFDVVAPASVPAAVKELCGDKDCVRNFHLGSETGIPFSKIFPAIVEVRKSSTKMHFGGIVPCKPGENAATDRRRNRAFAGDLKWDELDRPWPLPPPGTKLPPSTLKELAVKIAGGVLAEEVRAAMAPKMADFKQCYAMGLQRNPNLQGDVTVGLEIGKKGAVMGASRQRSNPASEILDNDVAECIVEAAATISLPGKGTVGTVSYALALTPK